VRSLVMVIDEVAFFALKAGNQTYS
jgi:hypothetical protein